MTQQEFHQRYIYNAITDKLSEDGFSSVFRAYDNHLDQWVALTILTVNPQPIIPTSQNECISNLQ